MEDPRDDPAYKSGDSIYQQNYQDFGKTSADQIRAYQQGLYDPPREATDGPSIVSSGIKSTIQDELFSPRSILTWFCVLLIFRFTPLWDWGEHSLVGRAVGYGIVFIALTIASPTAAKFLVGCGSLLLLAAFGFTAYGCLTSKSGMPPTMPAVTQPKVERKKEPVKKRRRPPVPAETPSEEPPR